MTVENFVLASCFKSQGIEERCICPGDNLVVLSLLLAGYSHQALGSPAGSSCLDQPVTLKFTQDTLVVCQQSPGF